jgi:hypothetical protein
VNSSSLAAVKQAAVKNDETYVIKLVFPLNILDVVFNLFEVRRKSGPIVLQIKVQSAMQTYPKLSPYRVGHSP